MPRPPRPHPTPAAGLPTRKQILDYIRTSPDAAGKREIARAFGLKGQEKIALKALLRDMADEGLIDGRKTAFHEMGGLPRVTVLRVMAIEDGRPVAIPDSWRPEDATPPPRLRVIERKGSRSGRHGSSTGALKIGDRVLARTEEVGAETNRSWLAHPMKTLPARAEQVLGVVEVDAAGKAWLAPVDKRVRGSWPIAELGGAEAGRLVLAEPVGRGEGGGVKVTQVLGDPLAPRAFSLIAIHKHGIPNAFAAEALAEAEAAARLPLDPDRREDLRHLPIVAIDPVDARDHDDAIWAEPDADPANPGGFRALIAIADVSFYVRPGSETDREARKRGNSVYFPDRVVPMLPHVLSADVCSLGAGADRAAMACHLTIDARGRVRDWRFARAIVRIAEVIAYEDAQARVDGAESGRHHPPTPSSEEEGEQDAKAPFSSGEGEQDERAPSSSEEGVGGGASPQAPSRALMLNRAAQMRREPSGPERRMWLALRDRRLAEYKFRRQAVIGARIADFFCPAKGLVVEIDGETHDRERDLRRDAALERETGFLTVRFTNREVMENLEGVLVSLLGTLTGRSDRWSRGSHHPPTPSSEEEGEQNAEAPSSSGREQDDRAPSSSEEGVGGGASPQAHVPIEVLRNLWACWRALDAARAERDPLDLDLPERRVVLDAGGRIAEIALRERLDAHRVVEEFMIAANVAAAKALEGKQAPTVYRLHEAPGREKLVALRDYLATFDRRLALGQVITPGLFNRLLKDIGDEAEKALIMESVLRSQTQAYYGPRNVGHFGLALGSYAHFTSPIRRYADLLVHRALVDAYGLEQPAPKAKLPARTGLSEADRDDLGRVSEAISATERRAMAAERETIDRYVAAWLSARVGEVFETRVTGVQKFGLFATILQLGGDGLVPISTLGAERFGYDEKAQALVGERTGTQFRTGDRLRLRLAEANPLTGALKFEPEHGGGAAVEARGGRPVAARRDGAGHPVGRRGRPGNVRHQGRRK